MATTATGPGTGEAGGPAPGVSVTEDETPLYEKWWFWGVVGGGVLVTAGTIFLLTRDGETRRVLPRGELETIDAR